MRIEYNASSITQSPAIQAISEISSANYELSHELTNLLLVMEETQNYLAYIKTKKSNMSTISFTPDEDEEPIEKYNKDFKDCSQRLESGKRKAVELETKFRECLNTIENNIKKLEAHEDFIIAKHQDDFIGLTNQKDIDALRSKSTLLLKMVYHAKLASKSNVDAAVTRHNKLQASTPDSCYATISKYTPVYFKEVSESDSVVSNKGSGQTAFEIDNFEDFQAEERYQSIVALANKVNRVHHLSTKFNSMIKEQGETLDHIFLNLLLAKEKVASGTGHLQKAEKHHKKTSHFTNSALLVLGGAVLVLGGVEIAKLSRR